MDLEVVTRMTKRSELSNRKKYIFKFSSIFLHTNSDSGRLSEGTKVVRFLDSLLGFEGNVMFIGENAWDKGSPIISP